MIVAIMSSETMECYSLGRDEKEAKEAILHSWNNPSIDNIWIITVINIFYSYYIFPKIFH